MKKYIVYTKVNSTIFYICHTEAKGFFVSADAPDNEVLQFTEESQALKIASDNTNENVVYNVKKIEL